MRQSTISSSSRRTPIGFPAGTSSLRATTCHSFVSTGSLIMEFVLSDKLSAGRLPCTQPNHMRSLRRGLARANHPFEKLRKIPDLQRFGEGIFGEEFGSVLVVERAFPQENAILVGGVAAKGRHFLDELVQLGRIIGG